MACNLSLSEIPTLTQLYRSRALLPSRQAAVAAPSTAANNILSHIRYDITKLEVGCIVNAANQSLLGGGGVDGAIHRVAGPQLLRECRTLNGCRTGEAKITDGYQLPAKKVIHAVGPIYYGSSHEVAERHLRGCYRQSLELAVQYDQRSIAFSAISTGVYGYPNRQAAKAAIDEVAEFLRSGDNISKFDRVIFCSFMPADVQAYETLLPVYFPPTAEDLAIAEQDQNSQTQDDAVIVDKSKSNLESDSEAEYEHDWEEIPKDENGYEDLLDEPVQVEEADQDASVADVRSMQSSTADFDVLEGSESDIRK